MLQMNELMLMCFSFLSQAKTLANLSIPSPISTKSSCHVIIREYLLHLIWFTTGGLVIIYRYRNEK